MVRGRVLWWLARALPILLVAGLFGVSQADNAGALGPALLVSITVSPAVASVAQDGTQQFTATGTYSDLSTKNLTNSVTWSTSSASTATISNASGSQGLATGIGTGVATITAKDTSALLSGTAALTVTPTVTLPTTTTTTPTTTTTTTTDPTLPTLPATLVTVTVTPPVANVAVGAGEQFTATGTYSDLSTRDLTDSVTWSSSSPSTASIFNTAGSKGLATGVAEGATTISASDPSSLISGTAALTVTDVTTPVSSAPPIPQLALSPATGKRKSAVVAHGSGFTPGTPVTITYLSGLKARKRASTVLCHTTAASSGTFACRGSIPRMARAGKRGLHTIEATGPTGGKSTSTFNLVRR
jgi:hypothetical protein